MALLSDYLTTVIDSESTQTLYNKTFHDPFFTGTVTINNSYRLPYGDGSANQIMVTDGAGNLSWGDRYSISIAADDSTLVPINAGESIKFIGAGAITTTSDSEGNITITGPTDTDDLPEGSTNLYYTNSRVATYLSNNSYATELYVDTAIANLVDSAPAQLDTLNELAAALNDDANFASTVTAKLSQIDSEVFGIAADDSAIRFVSLGESIKFIGGNNITTASDNEGNITIYGTYDDADVATYLTINNYTTTTYVDAEISKIQTTTTNYINAQVSALSTNLISVAADDSTLVPINAGESIKFIGGTGISTTSDSEGNITIEGPDLTGYATETYVDNAVANIEQVINQNIEITIGDVNQALDVQIGDINTRITEIATGVISVAADDSTLVPVNAGESIKFIGDRGISTSSDSEGNITITGPDLSNYLTADDLVTEVDTLATVTARGATTTESVTVGELSIGSEYTFPTTDGDNGQVLVTNGSGVLIWATLSGGGAALTTINSIPDVDTNGAKKGDVLVYDGTTWVAQESDVEDHIVYSLIFG